LSNGISKVGQHRLGKEKGTLGDDGAEDFLSDRVEHLLFVVLSEQLVNFWQFFSDWLLQDSKRDSDGL
jgi:hypothetical protein